MSLIDGRDERLDVRYWHEADFASREDLPSNSTCPFKHRIVTVAQHHVSIMGRHTMKMTLVVTVVLMWAATALGQNAVPVTVDNFIRA